MNKLVIITFAALLFSSSNLLAQFENGDIYLEGSVRAININEERFITVFNGSEKVETQTFLLTIIPTFNFFINDDVSVYAGVGYDRFKSQEISGSSSGFTTYDIIEESIITSIGVRMYNSLSPKMHFYTSIQSFTGYGKTKPEDGARTSKSDNFNQNLSIRHGLVYSISDKFLLSASFGSLFLSYSKNNFSDSNIESENWTYGLNTNLNSLSVSIAYRLK